MKSLMYVMTSGLLLLTACTKEQQPPPNQEVLTQQEQAKTGATMMAEAKEMLTDAKDQLIQEGKLTCCLKEPCNMCPLEENECDCYKDIKKGEHVCVECYAGWQQGKGGIAGIKTEDVKTDFVKHSH